MSNYIFISLIDIQSLNRNQLRLHREKLLFRNADVDHSRIRSCQTIKISCRLRETPIFVGAGMSSAIF